MAQVATDVALKAMAEGNLLMDTMQITWNLNDGSEVESPETFFWHMDDFMNGVAYAMINSSRGAGWELGIEWVTVTSYVVTVVKDCTVPQSLHQHGVGAH